MGEHVQRELGRHAGTIVVRRLELRRILLQVDADERTSAGANGGPDIAHDLKRFVLVEISER